MLLSQILFTWITVAHAGNSYNGGITIDNYNSLLQKSSLT